MALTSSNKQTAAFPHPYPMSTTPTHCTWHTLGQPFLPHLGEDVCICWHLLHSCPDLIKVLCNAQLIVAMGVQQPKVGVELLAIITRQLRADTAETRRRFASIKAGFSTTTPPGRGAMYSNSAALHPSQPCSMPGVWQARRLSTLFFCPLLMSHSHIHGTSSGCSAMQVLGER